MAEEGQERLRIEFPAGERAPAELPGSGNLVLGSSPSRADVVLEGEGIEDVHCTIRRLKGGGWALVDTGTRIGTRVNGRLATKVRLKHGDRVSIGPVRLEITDPRSANQPVAPEELLPPAPSPPATAIAASPPARPPRENGSGVRISGYRIERTLGRGGMGQVYLAVQERLDRKVALKVLPPRLAADAEFVRRFEDEARAAAALNHPNVVTVYDVGEEGGKHFLSMEYMHQGCLESRLSREGRLPWPVVLDVLRDAAAGLVYAESRGIVHRDIKPSNLMQNEDGATKIADLGLAVQVEEGDSDGGERLLGTPHFIAPELIRGDKADSRSDLYSLGATAYRLVTGTTPFDGESAREILRHVLHDEPRPVASLAPDVPAELGACIERLLAKDPIERHPSAAILLAELDRVADGGAPQGTRAPEGSSAFGKLVLGGAALGLLAGGVWFAQGGLSGSGPDSTGTAARGDGGPRAAERGDASYSPAPAGDGFAGLTFDEEEEASDAVTDAEQEDMAARLLEAEAEVEYLKLGEEALSDEDREARLDDLASRYKGTNTAFRAAAEADASRAAREEALTLRRENRAAVDQALEVARRQTSGIAAIEVNAALRAVRESAVPDKLGQDPTFLEGRRALEGEVVTRAIEATRTVLDEADTLAAQGDFDGVRRALEEYCQSVQLPGEGDAEATDTEGGDPLAPPPGAAVLEQLATRAFARLAGLEEEERLWRDSQLTRDRAVIARAFRGSPGGPPGIGSQLAAFELEAAHEALAALGADVHTRVARSRLDRLAQGIGEARDALATLGSNWDSWRRRSVTDPRSTRLTSRDTVGADARGVLIAGDAGTEHVPWSAWSRDPRGLHVLFNERFDRPWSAEELDGIAGLFRIAATTRAAAWAEEAIQGAGPADDGTRWSDVSAFYDQALEWATAAGDADALGRERATARLLAESLAAADEGSPSIALARLERLLREHADSLLVLLLSDGGDWELERPELPAAAHAGSTTGEGTVAAPVRAAPETGAGGGGDDAGED